MVHNPIGISMAQPDQRIMMVAVHVVHSRIVFRLNMETTIVLSGDLLVAAAGYR